MSDEVLIFFRSVSFVSDSLSPGDLLVVGVLLFLDRFLPKKKGKKKKNGIKPKEYP
ncbi:MAG: hypothetical protein M1477_06345 [Candidatus Thermoplasmatota archaeon]|nr:hypothetical protein [Candidatus Thermoplasmatota archaeon]